MDSRNDSSTEFPVFREAKREEPEGVANYTREKRGRGEGGV